MKSLALCRFNKFLLVSVLFTLNIKTVYSTEIDVKTGECKNAPTIFVSVASYRDKECQNTLIEIFNKAKCPERITVGICQQNDEQEDPDCLKKLSQTKTKIRSEQVNIIRLKHTEAQGPTWARYLASKLWKGEDYYLQIDSHMRFIKNWDHQLIEMIKMAPTNKAIISHYPLEYHPNNDSIMQNYQNVVPIFSNPFFNKEGILQIRSQIIPRTNELRPTYYVAAGMMFGPSSFLAEVPFDPHLPFLFHGEEILFTARLYVAGWRFYSPNQNVNFHYYNRYDAPHVWSNQNEWRELQSLSLQRLRHILEVSPRNKKLNPHIVIDIEKYGISNKAALKEYFKKLGVDWEAQEVVGQ